MDARTFAPNSYCTTRLQSEEEIFCINFKFARYAWNVSTVKDETSVKFTATNLILTQFFQTLEIIQILRYCNSKQTGILTAHTKNFRQLLLILVIFPKVQSW